MNKNDRGYILVTGAAGYIGSIVSEELLKKDNRIIALDNLSQGHRESIPGGAVFIRGDVGDIALMDEILNKYRVNAVVHLAASTLVGESVTDPRPYFQNNIVSGLNMLNVMLRRGVNKLVFSSSCAVYGNPNKRTISENAPKSPVNPYGEAKLAFERFLYWYAGAYGLRSVSLRYFNAAGASLRFGEDHSPETHLIPLVLRVALGQAEKITVFGDGYPTKDGSCVRDYVHVVDIARAHVLALARIDSHPVCEYYNLGNGQGYSVLEVIEAARRVTGAGIPVTIGEPRRGDPPLLVADAGLARSRLGWEPEYTGLDAIIESAYRWMKRHPSGYKAQVSQEI